LQVVFFGGLVAPKKILTEVPFHLFHITWNFTGNQGAITPECSDVNVLAGIQKAKENNLCVEG
jgi:hypothetical protein